MDRGARTPSATRLIEELAAVAPPEVRRQLASTVEGQRGGRKARMHVRAREEERDTELSRPPSIAPARTDEEAAPLRRKPRRTGLPLMLAAGLVVSLVGAFTGTRWLERRAQAPEAVSAPVSASVPAPAPAPVPVPVPATVAPRPSERQAPARVGKGWVHVVVQP